MKKGVWSRLLALCMAMVLALGLCACGGKGETDEGGSNKDKGTQQGTLGKENVYRVQEISLPKFYEAGNGSFNVQSTVKKDGRIYMVVQVYDYSVYKEYDYRVISMKEDGTDLQVVNLEFPGAPAEEPGADIPQEVTEETEEYETYDEPVNEYTSYYNFVLSDQGDIYGMKSRNVYDNSDPNGYKEENTSYICSWSMDGSFLWEKQIPELTNDGSSWSYIAFMTICDGNVYMLIGGDQYSKLKLDAEGNVIEKKSMPQEAVGIFQNSERNIPMEDGSVICVYHDEADWSKTYLGEYNMVNDTVSGKRELAPGILNKWDYNVMSVDEKGNLIFTGGSGIYRYQEGDTEARQMMDYVNSDFFIENMTSIVELSDTSFLAIYMEDWNEGVKAGIFNYVKPEDIVDKKVMVLAGQWIDYNLRKRVVDYNKNNQSYRIVIRDYSQYNTYDDYNAAQTKLNNDIISGDMPDILYTQGLPMENYINKGLIADIGKLIAEDEELSKVEFMQNVFDAYSVEGKLYQIISGFQVSSMAAKKKFVGDRTSLTMNEAKQIADSMGDGASVFSLDMNRNSFMVMALRYCGSQFVNPEEGKCTFNSEDFISMMEYAKTLPSAEEMNNRSEEDWDYYWQSYQSQYREDRALLMQTELYNFMWMAEMMNGNFGEEISFVGFPSGDGQGAYLSANDTYAISAKSKNIDEAWNFMRYYLTEEYQSTIYGFPVNKKIFLEKSKEATEKPYWTDENGVKQYYDNTMYINGEEIVIEPLTQQQLDQVIRYIESIHTSYYYNEYISNIVNEEIEAFFSGQKPAKDVADIIQRRAQLYMDENL